jgi:hypothetical protein
MLLEQCKKTRRELICRRKLNAIFGDSHLLPKTHQDQLEGLHSVVAAHCENLKSKRLNFRDVVSNADIRTT